MSYIGFDTYHIHWWTYLQQILSRISWIFQAPFKKDSEKNIHHLKVLIKSSSETGLGTSWGWPRPSNRKSTTFTKIHNSLCLAVPEHDTHPVRFKPFFTYTCSIKIMRTLQGPFAYVEKTDGTLYWLSPGGAPCSKLFFAISTIKCPLHTCETFLS